MKSLVVNLVALCCALDTASGQSFFSTEDKNTKYQGYNNCGSNIKKWKAASEKVIMKYEATKGDTIIFRCNFRALLSVKSDYPQSDSQSGLRLIYYKNQILISYPPSRGLAVPESGYFTMGLK